MRDADCAKNTENALKKYLVEKIVKNTNQKQIKGVKIWKKY